MPDNRCVLIYFGTFVKMPMKSVLHREHGNSAVTPLSTIAVELINEMGIDNASDTVCTNLIPCLSCTWRSTQDCADQCIDPCHYNKLDGKRLSVFNFDAHSYYMQTGDIAWLGWLVAEDFVRRFVDTVLALFSCAGGDPCTYDCRLCPSGTVSYSTVQA